MHMPILQSAALLLQHDQKGYTVGVKLQHVSWQDLLWVI
jgi:hypothetical protein